jgi:hypothetical protein
MSIYNATETYIQDGVQHLGSSNSILRMAIISRLTSKWVTWNHRFVSGYTMHGTC